MFGSILTSHFNASSDVDILVRFEKERVPTLFDLVDIEAELTSIVGRQAAPKTTLGTSSNGVALILNPRFDSFAKQLN
jgi:predicted nucleotidyltransferase